ncbi:DUF1523 family protein [Neobacillus drentensis]|uniref:DUF1523 family protein n=1 Tax=Neobacillus drentensis TaxID=220684 RepID=UPI001F258ED3|nr:DUF1523 family protein [Neobacillus drentensis]ULT55409.1 DUF1523 family protein [Neobacillus drentensis]
MKQIIGFVSIFVLLLDWGIFLQTNTHEYTVKVTDKTVKNTKEESKYLIFTEDKEGTTRVFKDTDSLLRFKFNSSDMYSQIKVNKTYKIKTYGLRVPFFSMYENIIEVEKVNK